MSYQNAGRKIQIAINEYANVGRSHPVINYFMDVSAANTAIGMNDVTFLRAQGKRRTVQINYWPIQCDIEGECGQGLCTTGEVVEPTQRDFEITQCTATKKWSLRLEDLRSVDPNEWDVDFVARTIISTAMPAARKLLATDMLTYALTKVGVHADGNNEKRVVLLNPATGAINPMGYTSIKREYMDAGQDMPYVLGGGAEIFGLRELQGRAGLNQQGVDTGAVQVPNLYYDENLLGAIKGSLASGDYILAIDPRMFKMVSFINNAGIFRTDLDGIEDINKLFTGAAGHDFILGTVTDPVTGVIWDLYLNFEKCGTGGKPEWSFHLEHIWDMFVMPDINCNVEGYNGLTIWRTCPEVVPECPTGDAPQSPATATTYNWNPAFTYPLNVYSSVIGGVARTLEEPVTLTNDASTVAFMNDAYGANVFSLSGSNISYTGYTELDGTINGGSANSGVDINFS